MMKSAEEYRQEWLAKNTPVDRSLSFDVTPFFAPHDPWPVSEGFDIVRRIYADKFNFVRRLHVPSILEIGVRAGYSAAMFLTAFPNATYLGLDADVPRSGGWPGAPALAKAMLDRCFPGRAEVRYPVDTRQLLDLPTYGGHYWDLVHVDGSHVYHDAKHDLEMAAKVARWVLVDDITHEPKEVGEAVRDVLAENGWEAIFSPTVRGDMLIRVR